MSEPKLMSTDDRRLLERVIRGSPRARHTLAARLVPVLSAICWTERGLDEPRFRSLWQRLVADPRSPLFRLPAGKRLEDHFAALTEEAHPLPREPAAQHADALYDWLRCRLPERGRVVLRYLYVDGLQPAEVARVLGVEPKAIANWQERLREATREYRARTSEPRASV